MFQLHINGFGPSTLVIDIDRDEQSFDCMSIKDLKARILNEKRVQMEPDSLRLFFAGNLYFI